MLKSKKITIFLIEDSGKGMKAVSLPSIFLASVFLCLILSALVVGLIFCDYRISKPKIAELTKAESLCFHQKTQIAYLERRILDIHEKLKELNEYDLKLKNVAHIATGDEGGSLVGVGGSNPGGIGSPNGSEGVPASNENWKAPTRSKRISSMKSRKVWNSSSVSPG